MITWFVGCVVGGLERSGLPACRQVGAVFPIYMRIGIIRVSDMLQVCLYCVPGATFSNIDYKLKKKLYIYTENRGSWDSHGTLAYYIDIAESHYRNYKCYVPETHTTRISDTVEFFPKLVQMPKTSSEDRLAAILEDLKEV